MIRRIAGTTVAGIIGFACTAHTVLGGGQGAPHSRTYVVDDKVYGMTLGPPHALQIASSHPDGETVQYRTSFGLQRRFRAEEEPILSPPCWVMASQYVIGLEGVEVHPANTLGLQRLHRVTFDDLQPRSVLTPSERQDRALSKFRESRRVEPLSIAEVVILDASRATSEEDLSIRYDLAGMDHSTIAACILMAGRLTVWVDEPWKTEPDEVLQRFSGPLLLKRTGMAMEQPFPRWIRVAAIDAPFEEPFSAFAQGEDLYIVTDSGQTFLAKEVFKSMDPSQGEAETSHERPFVAERSGRGGMTIDRETFDRFQGTPTHELTPVAQLAGTRHVVIDEGHLLFVSDDAVTDTKLRRTPMRRRPPSAIPAEAEGHMRTVLECLPAILDARQARE